MEEIKRTFSLKLKLSEYQKKKLNSLLENWGSATIHTFNYIKRIYEQYDDVRNEEKIGQCYLCNNKDIPVAYKHKLTGAYCCSKCFMMLWSIFTLTKADGYQKDLIEAFPDLAKHKGYYAGVIKYSVPMFKSWISKKEDRKREIEQLTLKINSTTELKKKVALSKILERKEKGIKNLFFNKNVLYLGNAGMFDFKKENDQYFIGITHPHEKYTKIWYKLKIGIRKSYKTQHNKYELIDECIEKKIHKVLFGKILRRQIGKETIYEFMFPKRDVSHSLSTKDQIHKLVNEKKDIPIISLSFGIQKPITMVAMQERKIKEIKTFGDGSLWHFINRERGYRAKVMKVFAQRYVSKWKRRKAKKNFFKKRGDSERLFIKYNTHFLTTKIINYISKKYGEAVIIMREMKSIKRIHYPKIYMTALSRWNVAMQNAMLNYKAKLKSMHLYKIPYNQSNNLECSRCHCKQKDEKGKEIKNLTIILMHGINKLEYLKNKEQMLQAKVKKLMKYKKTKWLRITTDELMKIRNKLKEEEKQNLYKQVKCQKCSYQQDFYVNDALNLCSKLTCSARGS